MAGLTTALALAEAGFRNIVIYDADTPGAAPDMGLVLAPNATRVLHALGLKDALHSVCSYPQAQLQRTWRNGFLLSQRPLGQFAEDRYGAPHCVVAHRDLLKLLLEACNAQEITVIAQPCSEFSQAHDQVLVRFAEHSAHHDVLIGCDGANSLVRDHLSYPPPVIAGFEVRWGRAAIDELPRSLAADAITTWLGPGQFLTHWPSPSGEQVEYLALAPEGGTGQSSSFASTHQNWHHNVRALVDADDSPTVEPVAEHQPITQWYDRRIVLLGDACHTLPAHLQQGAALAMEDAWVLSRMLERWEDDPGAGFEEYQRYRKVRITRVRRASRSFTEQWTMSAPGAIRLRNLKLSLMSRFLPEMAMQQLDWLYEYDCIKGFE